MTRWKVSSLYEVRDEQGILVCQANTVDGASQIVREHNAHAATQELLEAAYAWRHGSLTKEECDKAHTRLVYAIDNAALRLGKGG